VKAGVFELVLTFLELLICATGEIDVILLWLFLFKLVEIPGLIYVLCQLYQIREGGRRVANGNYSQPIDTRHMMGGTLRNMRTISIMSETEFLSQWKRR